MVEELRWREASKTMVETTPWWRETESRHSEKQNHGNEREQNNSGVRNRTEQEGMLVEAAMGDVWQRKDGQQW